ncbi:thioredoxin [Rhodococcus rhodnii]|uniref:Thioredoxin n=2 Tax=Rhodococcus rhodnii TaxID=38312 RepID=R7WGY0_9NOCA|nr:thioredoxin family protein [Rhodococcus rhodnii]EOM74380.1 thioredoxin [Rhodococcus rhodnii LMG 5362]TXG89102.1 thioredoxin [Rhodococcus rhodnii]
MNGLLVVLAIVVVAVVVGLLLRRREGAVRATAPSPDGTPSPLAAIPEIDARPAGSPVVLHFSADWCGPCAAVRRVVARVTEELAETAAPPLDVELDIDEHPALAAEFGVLSLPTTFVLDGDLHERFRIAGVPVAAALRESVAPLTGGAGSAPRENG